MIASVGQYLASRLASIGIKEYFAVPGDYNLILLDEILKNQSLQMINCCNELNASYAADGYARINGVAACVVTFGVGGLSAINGIAGAYAENLPVIIISGAPNTNSIQRREDVHHTTGTTDHSYVRRIFKEVCATTQCIISPDKAPLQIDYAIEKAISLSKPVYIDISCNIANHPSKIISERTFSKFITSDNISKHQAIECISEKINNAVKPVIIAGSGCRSEDTGSLVEELSWHSNIPIAIMPDAKGFISEDHPNYMGLYWGPVSSENVCEIVESSDCYIFIGANVNDYTTSGYRNNISKENLININTYDCSLSDRYFTRININEIISELPNKIKKNDAALEQFKRLNVFDKNPKINLENATSAPVTRQYVIESIQDNLTDDHLVLVETGDAWFNGLELKLPKKARFEIQMQYGSIGWSVGATLGAQVALKGTKRVIALIGDGSFQMTAQELSTMIRYELNPIIILMNNNSYGIEVQIHDGPYNEINDWKYAELVEVFRGQNERANSKVVKTEVEMRNALEEAVKNNTLSLIEVKIEKDDCNKRLLQWGKYVAEYNSREPEQ